MDGARAIATIDVGADAGADARVGVGAAGVPSVSTSCTEPRRRF